MTQENASTKRDISTGGNFITTWNELDSSRVVPATSDTENTPINMTANALIQIA